MGSCWDPAIPREGEAELNDVGRLHGDAALCPAANCSLTALLEEAKQQAKLKGAEDQVTPEQSEVALRSPGFPTLYEEGADLAPFGVGTREDYDRLETTPTDLKDWHLPCAYILLFEWDVEDEARPGWCKLPREFDARQDGAVMR